jgi:hypothetical protein
MEQMRKRTFCGIGRFVVFCEPAEIFIFEPGDPVVVLLVVVFACGLFVRLWLFAAVVVRHDCYLSSYQYQR